MLDTFDQCGILNPTTTQTGPQGANLGDTNMNYQQVKQAYMNESFDLVLATQAQITKLESEFERTGNKHGADWVQSRYDDMQEEMQYMLNESIAEFA